MFQMKNFSIKEIDRIIEMAWEDRTPFEAITFQFGISEPEIIQLMRSQMKASSFKLWRKRMKCRANKHLQLRSKNVVRFKSKMQKQICSNKISKR